MEYIISEKAIKAIRANGRIFALMTVANDLNDTATVRRWVYNNKINGPLVTTLNLDIISKNTGLDKDSILAIPSPTLIQSRKKKRKQPVRKNSVTSVKK